MRMHVRSTHACVWWKYEMHWGANLKIASVSRRFRADTHHLVLKEYFILHYISHICSLYEVAKSVCPFLNLSTHLSTSFIQPCHLENIYAYAVLTHLMHLCNFTANSAEEEQKKPSESKTQSRSGVWYLEVEARYSSFGYQLNGTHILGFNLLLSAGSSGLTDVTDSSVLLTVAG